jgi:diguanylate cyclase (GGDEF)-like protein
MWRTVAACSHWSGEIANRRKNGEIFSEWLTIHAVCNERGAVTHYIGIFSDLTQRKAAEVRLNHVTEFDALTELPNRKLIMSRLQRLTETTALVHGKVGVLFIDLDRFNNVNDSMGHEAGDLLLQMTGRRICGTVRASDNVARMGADEFIVLLPELRDENDALVAAKRILDAIRAPLTLSGQDLVISASVGVSVFPEDGADAEELVRNATAAMNRAKMSGRDGYQRYAHEMNDRAADQLRTENALRLALDRNELVLHYQPQIDLVTGAIVGAEALIRWNRPGVGLVMPGQFMDIAQERGLMLPIGRWVIREAIGQLARWDAAGLREFVVAVNLTAGEFHQKGFVDAVAREIRDHKIDAARLEIELTESIAVHDIEATRHVLHALHELGVRLSLDDFGTGYSSLSYLRRFPIDKIKIDQSFIREMGDQPESIRIVRAIIALARSFGMKVIAEGVETEAQLRALREEHCDEIQGYLVSRALPQDRFLSFFENWQRGACDFASKCE